MLNRSALDEDATEAAKKLNGSEIDRRKISVEVAKAQKTSAKAPAPARAPPVVEAVTAAVPIAVPTAVAKRPRPPAQTRDRDAEGEVFKKKPKVEAPLMQATQKGVTMVLFGLSPELDKKKLWVRLRKTHGVQKCDFPVRVPGSTTGCTVALVTYDTAANASSSQKHLDGHNILGSVVCARRGIDVRSGVDAHNQCRLIVRNMPFDALPVHVQNALDRHVPAAHRACVTDVYVPLRPGAVVEAAPGTAPALAAGSSSAAQAGTGKEGAKGEDPGSSDEEDAGSEAEVQSGGAAKAKKARKVPKLLTKGFGFIQCATKEDAAAVLAALNGKRVHKREVVVDWAVPQGQPQPEAVPKEGSGEEGGRKKDAEEDGDSDSDSEEASLLSDAEEKTDSLPAGQRKEMDEEEDASGSEHEDDDDEDDEDEEDSKEGDEEEDSEEEEEESKPALQQPAAPQVDNSDASKGTTLFLRNVSFDTLDSDLIETFKVYGPVKYARVVVDHSTGRSKGTAFVQFYTKEGADRALAAGGASDDKSEDYASARPGENEAQGRKRQQYAAAVEATLLDGGIRDKPGGRPLLVARARTHEESKRASDAKAAESGVSASGRKYDARHTYLSHEGNIRAESEAGQRMPATDRAKREEATKGKKKKLLSPLFFISPTRLSVRNLAKHVDDTMLKQLARQAALEGMKKGLASPKEGDPRLMPAPGAKIPLLKVITAKVLREPVEAGGAMQARRPPSAGKGADRADAGEEGAAGGSVVGRSKGFGFVEFGCHLHALAALRHMNNNPAYSRTYAAGGSVAIKAGKKEDEWPRLLVEFSVENMAKVKKHEERKATARAKRQALMDAGIVRKGDGARPSSESARGSKGKGKQGKPAQAQAQEKGKPQQEGAPAPGQQTGKRQREEVPHEKGMEAKKVRFDGAAKAAGAGRPQQQGPKPGQSQGGKQEQPQSALRAAIFGKGAAMPGRSKPSADAELDDLLADIDPRSVRASASGGSHSTAGTAAGKRGRGADSEAEANNRRAGKKAERSAEDRTDAMIGEYMRKLYGSSGEGIRGGQGHTQKGPQQAAAAASKGRQGGEKDKVAAASAPVIEDKWL